MEGQREKESGRRWILAAFFVFLLFLLLWIAAAFLLNIASAEGMPFSLGLRSRLAANYSPDEFHGTLGVFRLSIIDEVFHDRGMPPEEVEEKSEEIKLAMGSPVPTATARGFGGEDPYTPTPTEIPPDTPEPSETETPLSTATIAIVVTASKTPPPAATPKVVAKTPTSGPSPTPTKCWVNPFIEILAPPDGAVYTLADNLPAEAFAYDPDNVDPDTCQLIGVYPSDNGVGIDEVEFEIWWLDAVPDVLVHSEDQSSAKYCGFTGTTSCDTFPVNSSTWPGGEPVSGGLHKLKARARDDGDNWSNWAYVYFTLNIATPTPTTTPTATKTPSPTTTATATPTDTPTGTPIPADICSNISFTNFSGVGSNNLTWDIYNSNGFTVTLTHINLTWPTANGELNEIQIGGSYSWSGSDDPPSANRDVSGSIPDPGPTIIRFQFDNSTTSIGYTLIATFDDTCDVTVIE